MNFVSRISSLLNLPVSKYANLHYEFLPLPFDKYISIYNEQSVPSNFYDYFNDIIDDIYPYLKSQNIHIVQFLNAQSDLRIKNCFYLEKFSYGQLNFILKNSMLHLCTDVYTNEICAISNTKSINLIGNRYPNSSKAYFGKDNNIIINKFNFKKPTFTINEIPKSINKINTETISKKCLDILAIDNSINYNTLFTGSSYHEYPVCDIIPNFKISDEIYSKFNTYIRMDLFNNESNCIDFCLKSKFVLIVSNKVSENFINICRNNCNLVIFYLSNHSKYEDLEFFINKGIKVQIVANSGFDISEFIDFGKINFLSNEVSDENKKLFNNKNFKTSKLIISNNKKYASYAHLEKGIEMSTINKCIDSPLFWQDDSRYKIIGENNE